MTTWLEKNDSRWQLYELLILLLGSLLMTSAKAGGQRVDPLGGPDFVLEKVASWTERPGADAELVLRDGSSWKLKPGTKIYETQRDTVTRAMQRDTELFVSGDRSRGFVDIVVTPRRLAAEEISSKEVNGRYSVGFQGPPSVYYLRTDRPWFAQALSLLQRSASGGGSFSSPDLLVAIDPRNSEITAVRPLNSPKPASPR